MHRGSSARIVSRRRRRAGPRAGERARHGRGGSAVHVNSFKCSSRRSQPIEKILKDSAALQQAEPALSMKRRSIRNCADGNDVTLAFIWTAAVRRHVATAAHVLETDSGQLKQDHPLTATWSVADAQQESSRDTASTCHHKRGRRNEAGSQVRIMRSKCCKATSDALLRGDRGGYKRGDRSK